MAHAIRVHKAGGPEVLSWDEVAVGDPGPGEARVRQALRLQVSDLLSHDGLRRPRVEAIQARVLHKAADCLLHLPARIGDYTDFYAGIHHATNTGRMMRPDSPLLPNYRYVPVGYHGRVSSIGIGGTADEAATLEKAKQVAQKILAQL